MAGLRKRRRARITVFSSTGLAEDAAVANIAYENAIKRGAGTKLRLVT